MSQQRIIDTLDAAPETISPILVLDQTGRKPKDINALLFKMLDDGDAQARALIVLHEAEPVASIKVPAGF